MQRNEDGRRVRVDVVVPRRVVGRPSSTYAHATAGRWAPTEGPAARSCRMCDCDTWNTSGLCTPCELMKAALAEDTAAPH